MNSEFECIFTLQGCKLFFNKETKQRKNLDQEALGQRAEQRGDGRGVQQVQLLYCILQGGGSIGFNPIPDRR